MSNLNEQPISGGTQPQSVAVTYYTLQSKYPNDFTKNCSLLSSEIDGNFYFLRGYDIKSFNIKIDENGTKRLYLERLNGEILEGSILSDDNTNGFKFEYDEENGIMTVTYPSGQKVELKYFNNTKCATNGTIKGDGGLDNPLRISEVETTGTYSPARELVEIPRDDKMPDGTPLGKGYRIVTKEYVTKFGRLYNYDEVEKISEQLKETGSPWRVPTKEDWDEMLNAIEICNDGRNHDSKGTGYLGKDAGALLKQTGTMEEGTGFWNDPCNPEFIGEDKYGFCAIPVGFSGPRGDFLKPDADNDIEGYHLSTAFWTSTPAGLVPFGNSSDSIYAKALYYKSRKVNQQVLSKESKLSLRLVKDFNRSNMTTFDDILGYWYPCTHIIANHSKYWYEEVDSVPDDADVYAYDEIPSGDDILLSEEYIKVGKRYYKFAERKYHHNKIWTAWNIGTNTMGYKSDQWNNGYYKEIDPLDVPENIDPTILDEIPSSPIVGKPSIYPEYIVVDDKTYHLVDFGVYSEKYFINEWDGEKWVKKMMNEGDSVAIINGPDGVINHEWRVFKKDENNDILIDTVNSLKDEIMTEIKDYIDERDKEVLQEAKDYADEGDKKTLQAAKDYADEKDAETLKAAKGYADEGDKKTLQEAKDYADEKDVENLQKAKDYADEKDAKTLQAAKDYADDGDEKTLAAANQYTDTKCGETLTKANEYTDEKIAEVNERIDNEVKTINDRIDKEVKDLNTKIGKEVARLDQRIDTEAQERKDADNAEAEARFNNDIAKANYTIGGGEQDTIEIKNNANETVVTLMFDGNFGEI